MKKETKNLVANVLTYILIALMFIMPIVLLTLLMRNVEQNHIDREQMTYDLYEAKLEAETYEAVSEMLGDMYEENKEELTKLQKKYDVLQEKSNDLIESNKYDIQQIISDYEDLLDYYINYTAFVERNPDIDFEQFLQLKNPEMYARIREYDNL